MELFAHAQFASLNSVQRPSPKNLKGASDHKHSCTERILEAIRDAGVDGPSWLA